MVIFEVLLAKWNLNESDLLAMRIVNKITTGVPWDKMLIWNNLRWEVYEHLQEFLRQHTIAILL